MKRVGRVVRSHGALQFLRTGRVHEDASSTWRRRRKAAGLFVLTLAVLLPVLPALAEIRIGVLIDFPTTMNVGDTQSAVFSVHNASTDEAASESMLVEQMRLVPSCSDFAPGCSGAGSLADPGTFTLSPTGVGAAGSACHGRTFNIAMVNPSTGEVSFTPADGEPVVLAPPDISTDMDVCRIVFTVTATKIPNHDSLPAEPGNSTNQLAFASGLVGDTRVEVRNEDLTTIHQT
ncbi:MAG TPA: hypothetical protein VM754_06000, partial [Actinomycetota bacterium]|nr:hypothetical protein [Actinomycetota bacterium]